MATETIKLADYTFTVDTASGEIAGLKRGKGPDVLGHGGGPVVPAASAAWKRIDAEPQYRAHRVEDDTLTIDIALGPLLLHDRFSVSDGLIARRVGVENASDAEVQLTGLRIGLRGASVGEAADCLFEAPANAIRPRLPLPEVAGLPLSGEVLAHAHSGAGDDHFAPGARFLWAERTISDAPDVGPGLMIVHNAALKWSLMTWYVSFVEAARPWVSGDGAHAALGFDLWLAGWLAPGRSLDAGTQYVELHQGDYNSALDAYRARFEQTGILPPVYGAVDNAADWVGVYEAHPGQFGGFEPMTEKLRAIRYLAVDTLYLMPVHPHRNKKGIAWDENWEGVGSPYGIHDFEKLEPSLGRDADFAELVGAAHDLGLRVLLDLVTQGSSLEAEYVKTHPEWYVRDEQGNMVHSHGWNDTWSFDWANPDYQQFVIDYASRYVEAFGIDGFRVDAPHGKEPNWDRGIAYHASQTNLGTAKLCIDLRKKLLALKPELALLCELFGPMWVTSHDVSYDYHPYAMALAMATGALTPAELGVYLEDYWAVMPRADDGCPTPRVCFTETHDTRGYPAYALRGSAVARALLGVLVMSGFVPMIWSGQEEGQTEFIRGLMLARRENAVLRRGKALFNAVTVDDRDHYRREGGKGPQEEVFTVIRHDDARVLFGVASLFPEQVTYRFGLPVGDLPLDPHGTYQLRDLITFKLWGEYGQQTWKYAELKALSLTPRMYQPYIFRIEAVE